MSPFKSHSNSHDKSWLFSSLALVGSSLVSIALALALSWNLFEVVVLYWLQALIIGIFQRQKICDMVDFHRRSGRSDYVKGRRLMLQHEPHKGFSIIYGLFWLMEGGILLAMYVSTNGLSLNSLTLLAGVVVILASHLFSYRRNKATDEQRLPTVERVFFMPFFRMLLPLHIFSVTVGFETDYGAGGILVWMLLKTALDLGIHIHEHRAHD